MSPKQDSGFFSPPHNLDDDQSSSNNNTDHPHRITSSPEPQEGDESTAFSEDNDSNYVSSLQIIQDGNTAILQEFEATQIARQYSRNQLHKGNHPSKTVSSVLTLDGVDWSGFSGAAHKAEGQRPRSSKRLQTSSSKEEVVELGNGNGNDSHMQESTLRLVQRKLSLDMVGCSGNAASAPKKPASSVARRHHSPGKFQSRRASFRSLLIPTSPVAGGAEGGLGTMPLNDGGVAPRERRPRASSRDIQSRGTSRSRRSVERLAGAESSAHTAGTRSSRRNLRSRATGEEAESAEGRSGDSGGHQTRVAKSERRLATGGSCSKPRKERSLSSSGVARAARTPRPDRKSSDRKPRKHRSAGVIDLNRAEKDHNGRSVSPKDKSRGKGLAAASATTLEVGSRPRSTRTRRNSHGNLNVKEFAGNELINTNKGSLRW